MKIISSSSSLFGGSIRFRSRLLFAPLRVLLRAALRAEPFATSDPARKGLSIFLVRAPFGVVTGCTPRRVKPPVATGRLTGIGGRLHSLWTIDILWTTIFDQRTFILGGYFILVLDVNIVIVQPGEESVITRATRRSRHCTMTIIIFFLTNQ